jgi:uncharacterized protein (UPF0276 family)
MPDLPDLPGGHGEASIEPLGVGMVLHAQDDWLDFAETVAHEVDFFEFAPEVTWGVPPRGELVFTRAADRFEELARGAGKPVVGHSLGFSPGTCSTHPEDEAEMQRWIEMTRRTHERFGFRWLLDHLGYSRHSGQHAVLPLPLEHGDGMIDAMTRCMRRMREVHDFVGAENAVWYCSLGAPADEPAFLSRLYRQSGAWLLLDLHNVYTHCVNFGLQWGDYLEALPLERVLCLHVSGGSHSDPVWVPGGTSFRLDSHDGKVPEDVWRMLEVALPRCVNARGVVVEYMEGTLAEGHEHFLDEVRRARRLWEATAGRRCERVEPLPLPTEPTTPPDAALAERQRAFLEAMYRPHASDLLAQYDSDGIELTALLVQKLRFERVMRADAPLAERFDADPDAFVELFDEYLRRQPASFYFPAEEARAFRAFLAGAPSSLSLA